MLAIVNACQATDKIQPSLRDPTNQVGLRRRLSMHHAHLVGQLTPTRFQALHHVHRLEEQVGKVLGQFEHAVPDVNSVAPPMLPP